MVLRLWVVTPLGVEKPFKGVAYQMSYTSGIYSTTPDSGKIALMN